MITADVLRANFDYNPLTGEFAHKYKNKKGNGKCGTINKRKYSDYMLLSIKHQGKYRRVYAHRAAWMIVNGDISDRLLVIDHIDGNGLNNKLSNLRLATKQINQRNRLNRKDNNSISGVYPHSNGRGYIVHFLGRYITFTKDYFEACCIRKSLENNTEGFNIKGN